MKMKNYGVFIMNTKIDGKNIVSGNFLREIFAFDQEDAIKRFKEKLPRFNKTYPKNIELKAYLSKTQEI